MLECPCRVLGLIDCRDTPPDPSCPGVTRDYSGFPGISRDVPRPLLPLIKMNKPRGRCLKNRVPGGGPRSDLWRSFLLLAPRWPPDPPTWSQDTPQTLQLGAKMAPDAQLGAKMAPRPRNLEPKWPPDPLTWSQDGPQTPQPTAKIPPRPRHGGGAGRQAVGYFIYFCIFLVIQLPDGQPRHRAWVWGVSWL